jgi:hypothetical protein
VLTGIGDTDEELGANHPFEAEAVGLVPELVASGSEPRTILASRVMNGMYFGWNGKLPETGDKLNVGVLDRKAIKFQCLGGSRCTQAIVRWVGE